MIKAIIFDCFGVFTGDKWKEFVGSLPEAQREPARQLNRALDAGLLGQAEFFEQVKELTGTAPERVENMINSEMFKNTELLSYVAMLKADYKIAMLSNVSSPWIRESFLSADESLLFDDMVFSYEVGMVKPDSRIFHLSADRLGVEPQDCVFIDDGEGNCEGARQVGMQAILYDDLTQLKAELLLVLHHT